MLKISIRLFSFLLILDFSPLNPCFAGHIQSRHSDNECPAVDISANYDENGEFIILRMKNIPSGRTQRSSGYYTYAGGAVGTLVGLVVLGPAGISIGAFAVAASFGVVGGVAGGAYENGGDVRGAARGVAAEIDAFFDEVEFQIPSEVLEKTPFGLERHIKAKLERAVRFRFSSDALSDEALLKLVEPLADKAARLIRTKLKA